MKQREENPKNKFKLAKWLFYPGNSINLIVKLGLKFESLKNVYFLDVSFLHVVLFRIY